MKTASIPPLGAHVSIAGGVSKAIARGEELGCDALQVFVKNASQWVGKPLADDEVERFRELHAASPIGPIAAHSTYLINLASSDPTNRTRSRRALRDELDRCERLGIPFLVLHPGAHLGAGEKKGLKKVATSLENTAGQGTVLGRCLSHLATIQELSAHPDRLGVCLDTCHAFAAGYPIHEEEGYEAFFDRIHELFGAREPSCLHLNDSKKPFDSRRDRHANIGQGEIGSDLFARLVHNSRLQKVPMILETPLGDDELGHKKDLELLRKL
jgi:deoxyribonuclease-4